MTKNLMKLAAAALTVSAGMMSLTGCASKAESTTAAKTEAGEAEYVIRYSHVQSTTSPTHEAMEWLKGWLEEQSGGKVTMEIYPAGQLYDDSGEIDAILAGNIDMISTYISKLTTLDTSMQYAIAPYLFDSTEQMLACYADPDVQSALFDNLASQGITVLGAFYGGDVMLFSGKSTIKTPADFKGLKVRENGGAMVQEQYSAMNASVVTVAYSELYTAVQSGLVDAVCTGLDGVTGIALQEVLTSGLDLEHQKACYLIQFNTDSFNSYPQEVQDLIREGVALASEKQLEICNNNKPGYIEDIAEGGCEVYEANEEEKEAFRAIWKPISDKYLPDDWKNAVGSFKERFRD